jgi:hypothetical protein
MVGMAVAFLALLSAILAVPLIVMLRARPEDRCRVASLWLVPAPLLGVIGATFLGLNNPLFGWLLAGLGLSSLAAPAPALIGMKHFRTPVGLYAFVVAVLTILLALSLFALTSYYEAQGLRRP